MATKHRVESDAVIPLGELLQEELEARGLTREGLAAAVGRPQRAIGDLCKGRRVLTADIALDLEEALGTPAHIWTTLEADYRVALARLHRHKNRLAS